MHRTALMISLLSPSVALQFEGVANYSAADFMAMPDFPDAVRSFDQVDRNATVEALLAVVAAHGLGRDVSVSFNHRHFAIAPDEQIVEVLRKSGNINETESTGKDETEKADETVTRPYPTSSAEALSAVPYMWCYVPAKDRFVPVEFVHGSTTAAKLFARLRSAGAAFARDYAGVLNATTGRIGGGVDRRDAHYFGLSLRHRSGVIVDPSGRGTMETNSVKNRTLRIRTVTKAEADAETEEEEEGEEEAYVGAPRQVHWSLRADYDEDSEADRNESGGGEEDEGARVARFARAAAASERRLGASHPATLDAQYNLAVVLDAAGRVGDAADVLERAVPVYAGVYGEGHEETAGVRAFLRELRV